MSEKLSVLVEESGLGAYDGHEMAEDNSYGSYYIYGQDAKALYEVIKKTLEETLFIAGANVTLRFGPPEKGVKEVSFILNLN